MKRLLILASTVLLVVNSLYAEVTKRELLDYFYPDMIYSMMTGDNYLGQKIYNLTPNELMVKRWINHLGYNFSFKEFYFYIFEHNKIVSNYQIIEDALKGGYEKYYDRKVLFVIPTDDKPYKWEETRHGEEKHNCEAINVYVTYKGDYYKAIKITDTENYTSDDKKKHSYVTWSYWIKDKGKVAEYGSLDGGKRTLLEALGHYNIYNDMVNEVTKDEYDDYFLKLEMKRSYERFKSSLQPVSISKYSSVYKNIEDKVFELISADTTSLLACKNIGQEYIDIKVYKNEISVHQYISGVQREKDGLKLGAVTDSLKKYVEHLVETDEIKIDSIKEEYTGEIGYIPQEMHLSIEYSKKAYMFSVAYKKGEWVIMKDSQEIPDFLKEKVEETANKFLLQNQKAKKQRIYITYIKLNNYLLFPQAEAVLYKK